MSMFIVLENMLFKEDSNRIAHTSQQCAGHSKALCCTWISGRDDAHTGCSFKPRDFHKVLQL